jgi:hypothetical protein
MEEGIKKRPSGNTPEDAIKAPDKVVRLFLATAEGFRTGKRYWKN